MEKGIFPISKRARIVAIVIVIVVLYTISRFFLFISEPIISLFNGILNYYLTASVISATFLLHLFGNFSVFHDHLLELTIQPTMAMYVPEVRYKTVAFAILLIIWLTKSPILKRILFSGILLLVHFTAVTLYNAFGLSLTPLSDYNLVYSVPDTIAFLTLFTCLVIWYYNNRESIRNSITKNRFAPKSIDKRTITLIIIIYSFIVLNGFVFSYFSFSPWIHFLFSSAHKLLEWFGVDSVVYKAYLIGDNGSIYMAKHCLGFNTMLLFVSGVYLTGKNNRERWIFIASGLIILNLANILRFVFLFIHLQKYGDYTLSMDLHDVYNYILYSIVFMLWIFWFEKYSDLKQKNRNHKEYKTD